MTEAQTLFAALRQSADSEVVSAIEAVVRDAPDNRLNRINALAFAAKTGLDPEGHRRFPACGAPGPARNVVERAPSACGGVLDAGASLETVNQTEYGCALCAAGYEPTLDEWWRSRSR